MSRILLDECLPRRLGRLFPDHEVMTVPQAGLAGLKNGKLMAAIRGRFEVFVTIDGNLEYQQNLTGLDFAVVVIRARKNQFAEEGASSTRPNPISVRAWRFTPRRHRLSLRPWSETRNRA